MPTAKKSASNPAAKAAQSGTQGAVRTTAPQVVGADNLLNEEREAKVAAFRQTIAAATAPVTPEAAAALPFREGEEPWTEEEVAEVRGDLLEELEEHRRVIAEAEADLQAMVLDGADGAGRDPADVGSLNFERDQEMSLAANARDMLDQALLALRAIEHGTYGRCEQCGEAIGKGRLQVNPRATMCVPCKTRQERR